MKNRWIGALLTLPIAVLGSEAAYRIAQPSPRAFPSGNCLVIALGAPSRPDGTASPLQRFRVEAAVATLLQQRCRGLLLTGGAVRNDRIEAVTMANLAKTLGMPTDQMVIEPSARNTWENVGCLHGRLRRAERVFVVSDTLHAQRAVRYACRQDSRLCGTVVNAGVVPPINQLWWSLPAAALQGVAFLRDRITFERNPAENAPLCRSDRQETGAGQWRLPVLLNAAGAALSSRGIGLGSASLLSSVHSSPMETHINGAGTWDVGGSVLNPWRRPSRY